MPNWHKHRGWSYPFLISHFGCSLISIPYTPAGRTNHRIWQFSFRACYNARKQVTIYFTATTISIEIYDPNKAILLIGLNAKLQRENVQIKLVLHNCILNSSRKMVINKTPQKQDKMVMLWYMKIGLIRIDKPTMKITSISSQWDVYYCPL